MSTTLRFQLICVYIPYCKFEIATVIIIDYNQFERSSRIDALSHHIRSSHPRLPTDATSPPPLSSSLTLTFFPSFLSVTPSDCLSILVYFFRAVCWSVHHFRFLFSFHNFSPSFSLPFVPSRPSPPPSPFPGSFSSITRPSRPAEERGGRAPHRASGAEFNEASLN